MLLGHSQFVLEFPLESFFTEIANNALSDQGQVEVDQLEKRLKLICNSERVYKNLKIQRLRTEHWNSNLEANIQQALARCLPSVEHLELDSCSLTQENYNQILDNMNLKVVYCYNCCVQEGNSLFLAIPKLQELRLKSCSNLMLRNVFYNTKTLKVLEVEIDESWTEFLDQFINSQTQLKELKIVNDSDFNHSHTFNLRNVNKLESVVLEFVNVTLLSMFEIQNMQHLQKAQLSIGKMRVSEEHNGIIRSVLRNKSLKAFKLIKHFNDEAKFLKGIQSNGKVKNMIFQEKVYDKHFLSNLVSITPNLTSLEVFCNGRYEEDADYCCSISTLKKLQSLVVVDLNAGALNFLNVNSKALNTVKLQLTGDAYEGSHTQQLACFFRAHQQITHLELIYTDIDNALCQKIIELLPNLKELTVAEFDDVKSCVTTLMTSRNIKSLAITRHQTKTLSEELRDLYKPKLNIFEIEFPY